MTSIAWYFAGLATLPVFVIVFNKLFPKQTVDNRCTFCHEIKRFPSWEAAEEYAKEHMARCKLHPLSKALERIRELEGEREIRRPATS